MSSPGEHFSVQKCFFLLRDLYPTSDYGTIKGKMQERLRYMRILAIGDVVGLATLGFLKETLRGVQKERKIDFTVVNGENVCDIHGIGAAQAKELLDAGADIITSGNHIFSRKDIGDYLDGSEDMLRPCNYPAMAPGSGYTIRVVKGWRILCINAMGCVFMESLASPFETVGRILEREKGKFDLSLLDFHAEATSEKLAMGRYFDGKIDVIFGTHTHVQTADEQILPHGTGYITDLGMTGPMSGILGVASECVVDRFLTKMPQKFKIAEGNLAAHGAVFEWDESLRRVTTIERIVF